MDILIWIIAATTFVSLLGLVGVFSLSLSEDRLNRLIYILTAFAVGVLLGGAFLDLLPESLQKLNVDTAMILLLSGFLLSIIVEVYFHWHLCVGEECPIKPYSYLLLAGDAVHNFLDGLVIASSFIVSVPFGLITTLVIVAHEIPEELGMFGVLVQGGIKRKKAITYSFLVQCTALIGGIVGYFISTSIEGFSSMLLPFAAGGFIYIAGSGLIPEIHKEEGVKKFISVALIIVGLLFMWVLKLYGVG